MLTFLSFIWSFISFFLPKKSNDIELGKDREVVKETSATVGTLEKQLNVANQGMTIAETKKMLDEGKF